MNTLAFVIGGAQKSGTTTLDAILRHHRGLQMAKIKETHFFDDESLDWSNPDYSRLHDCFGPDDGRPRGESTPITLYWRPAIRRLLAYNPKIRIVLLLRDPVTRAFAQWQKTWSEERETLTFAEAIRAYPARVASLAETEGLERHFSYVERGFYGAQISYLTQFAPKQNIHCEIFEEFVADRATALGRIAAFLGIAPFTARIPELHRHPAKKRDYPSVLRDEDIAFLRGLYREDTAALEAFLQQPIQAWRDRV